MKTRILTGAILAGVVIAAYVLPWKMLFPCVVLVLCVMMTLELLKCTGLHSRMCFAIPALIYSAAAPGLAVKYPDSAVLLVSVALLIVFLFMACVRHKETELTRVLTAAALILYAVGCMICFLRISQTPVRFTAFPERQTGRLFWLLGLLSAWLTDIFAYFGGRLFGKHKLCPSLSPHKTVEGSICGILGSVLTFAAFAVYFRVCCGAGVHDVMFVLAGIGVSVAAQCGDLFASLVKRTFGIKDFGSLLPGHGGMLDRFDSLLPVAVILYVILNSPGLTALLLTL